MAERVQFEHVGFRWLETGEENNDQRAGTDRKVIAKTKEYRIKEAKERFLSGGTGAFGSRYPY